MNQPLPSAELERFNKLSQEYLRRVAKDQQSRRGWYDDDGVRQGGLIAFVRYFWSVLEPENEFVDGWPLWAMCEHLEAAASGEINRLLITVPPGFMKSLLTEVFLAAFIWGPLKQPHKRFISFSYSAALTERDNDRFRTLITSERYQRLYGPMNTRFQEADRTDGVGLRNKTTIKVMNTHTGWKLASSVGGVATGERGDFVIIDDAHSVIEAESDRIRQETVRWFREAIPSRFNSLDTGVLIIIMQRVHFDDIAGVALGPEFNYCHLMIPWDFDPSRVFDNDGNLIRNQIGWADPRADEDDPDANAGEPAWLDRFSEEAMETFKKELGPYAIAGQLNQSPVPRGEGILRREWWKLWAPINNRYPDFDFIIASLDGAFTEKEENDYSGFTLWGVFTEPVPEGTGPGNLWEVELEEKKKIMLIKAWRKRLAFSAPRIPLMPNESYAAWRQRTQKSWGLMEWLYDSCTWLNGKPLKIDRLLIEAKGPGISAAQEIRSRYGIHDIPVQLVQIKKGQDKVARALAIQPIFSNGLVYAPEFDWSEMVIAECEIFPRGKHDDLVDSTTQALRYLRDTGLAKSDEEDISEIRERVLHRPRRKSLYPV